MWTCDVEVDFGGRTSGVDGLILGLPKILKTFKDYNVRALFFVSTEALDYHKSFVYDILEAGHEIGNHGHFHLCLKDYWRQRQNMELGHEILKGYATTQSRFEYRAPKFSHQVEGHEYSYREGHVGLLKHLWLRTQIPSNPCFYLHPFDLVRWTNAPSLFCKFWYSRPMEAYDLFRDLVRRYPGDMRLETIAS